MLSGTTMVHQTVASGNCYLLTLTGTDNVGNATSISTIVKVDTSAPNAPSSFSFGSLTNAYFPGSGSTVTNSDQFGFQGIKTFEQIVSPLNSDVHELPPFTFSFFDPDDGAYHTLSQPATPLLVHSAGTTPLPTIAGNKNSNAEKPASPQDILPIKENLGTIELCRHASLHES